jgi:hypothetical protein
MASFYMLQFWAFPSTWLKPKPIFKTTSDNNVANFKYTKHESHTINPISWLPRLSQYIFSLPIIVNSIYKLPSPGSALTLYRHPEVVYNEIKSNL